MTKETTVRPALVLRLSGDLGAGSGALAEAGDGLPPLVVLDLRELDLLTAEGARLVREFAEIQAAREIRCHVVVAPGSAAAQALMDGAGQPLPAFADLDQALGAGPSDTSPLANQFEAMTRVLLGESSVAAALEQILKATKLVVPAADLVSVTLRTPDGKFHTPVETDEVATELDQVQYRTGEGPCLDAARPEGPGYVLSTDLADEERWPEFAAATTARGYRSVLATELLQASGTGRPSGALNIYSHKPHGLTETDRHVALLLTTHASLALAHTHTGELADLRQAQLRQAVDSRDIIGQAKGILMHRQGIDADEAFGLLRRTSQDLNVKLVDLARTLTLRHGQLDQS
ncbi:GAF and ANTAR domain-containing protein [Amycolatopsis acidicola]|uniref:GAF and ANTAR domain-containing protein n=1 Tax=Amycolatopsis acidicola TaxID=2596893 RepID=A0A5N0ULW7_9PSEU|nr:GAF and ANTAR domain-containing protein [Amycolatopsis acidicola]KAA9150298.1 GAF and ANTAR domain-containing protein [Amycolatopsis acidicola]